MKNTKKILSLALTLAMLLSAVFCTGAVATAETTPTAFGYTAVTHSDPNVSVDLGQNLIPDSTVAEFDKNGNYRAYYGTTDGAVDRTKIANANAWWSSTHCDRAYTNWLAMQGAGVSGRVSNTVTHTEDGSGSIVHDYGATTYNSTFLNLPATETNTYYLFSFWVKSTAGSYLTIKFFNNDNALGGLQSTINTTTTWTQKMFIVSVANTKLDSFMGYNADANIKVYIDDIELYKLDGTYAEKCIAATKLLNGYTDSDTRKFVKTLTVDASFDFGTLGTNLAYDPNVSKFVDGVYDTTNGIKQGGAVGDGTVTFSTTGSHTSDGSGSVCLGTKNKNYAFSIAPKMAAKSYYLITYFVKPSEWKDTELRHYYSASSDSFVNLKTTNKGQWYRIVYIIYTGNTTPDTAIGTYTNTNVYYDDFGVYKLDPKYATECIAAGALSTPPTDEPAALTQNIKLFKVDTKTDLEQFGPNLFPDANVSAFDADGVYKDYSADSNAWWSKDTAWKKGGLKANGYITKDDTHTADGSGTLAINGHAYLPVPTMEANSYYVLSAWVKDTADGAWTGSAIYPASGGNTPIASQQSFGGIGRNAWGRVVYLIRTGDAPLDIVWNLYFSRKTFVDDFELRKIDDTVYAEECIAAGKFTNTNIAEATETVTTTANNQMINLPEKEGYFIPYGAVLDASGNFAEKLSNCQYFVANAGDVSYTYFRYPTGTVGTFGASSKADADDAKTGIQFGSLITDNLNVDENGTGTLVFRGDFEKFRKTFPTKTRAEVLNAIYKALKKANVTDGAAVKLNNGGESVVVINVPRKTYMWKNSANTELQYAVRVTNVVGNAYESVNFTAIGYVTKGGNVEFSNEIKTANYAELISAQN